MYSSIENRSPFLDSNLFQDCLNMPSKNYIKDGMAKWPLRKIINNIVPDKIRLNKGIKEKAANAILIKLNHLSFLNKPE